MRVIQVLVKQIRSELGSAENYARCACETVDTDKELSRKYYDIAGKHLQIISDLHEQVVREISTSTSTDESTLAIMRKVWEFEHEDMLAREAEVRATLSMYKR